MSVNGLKRVAITGIGTVSPIGNNVPTMWDSILKGKSGAAPITRFDATDFATQFACEIKDFQLGDFISRREANRLDLPSAYTLQAAHEALQDSGIELDKADRTRIACIIGIGLGSLHDIEEQHTRFAKKGPGRISPYLVPKIMPNAAAANVAITFGFQGPCYSTSSACAASANGMMDAYYTIVRGDADICVTGGVEAVVTVLGIGGFCSLKALSTRNDAPEHASRPFDKDRDGFVLGEGAASLVFEDMDRAKARGAKIYAEFAGGAITCDAYHISAPEPTGHAGARAMSLCMKHAGINPDQVDYINAHGTSTRYNDRTETVVIKEALGLENAKKTPISSTKSMTGHLLGGAAALEAVIIAKAMAESIIPPTINYNTPDPECDLDYVPNTLREAPINVALSNSLGFGGHNVAIAMKKV